MHHVPTRETRSRLRQRLVSRDGPVSPSHHRHHGTAHTHTESARLPARPPRAARASRMISGHAPPRRCACGRRARGESPPLRGQRAAASPFPAPRTSSPAKADLRGMRRRGTRPPPTRCTRPSPSLPSPAQMGWEGDQACAADRRPAATRSHALTTSSASRPCASIQPPKVGADDGHEAHLG